MTETPTSRALKNRKDADVPDPTPPEMPDPKTAPAKELTAYCKAVGKFPENWKQIKIAEKRIAFQRFFCPEVTAGFDPADKLHLISEWVENLKEADLPGTVADLTEDVGDTYFKLGGVFARVIAEGWYVETGHENFKQWVAATTDMKHAKAHYLVQIYEKLNRLDIPWEKFSGIGWTKVRILLPVITAENVDDWVEKAREMTRVELEEAVKEAKGTTTGDGGDESTVTKAFKLHKEQLELVESGLEQMKAELPTEFDNVALEHIVAFYLQGPQGEERVASSTVVDSVEDARAALKDLYTWLKENTDSPYEACGPVVDMFEAVFPESEASMRVKANGPEGKS